MALSTDIPHEVKWEIDHLVTDPARVVVRIGYRRSGERRWTRFVVVPDPGQAVSEITDAASLLAQRHMLGEADPLHPTPARRARITFDLSEAPAEAQERTARGKIICPLCGSSGWPPHWWEHHRVQLHVRCEECGRWFVEGSIRRHVTVMHKERA